MISLDGVMQAPGGPTEDPENGFKYGGWVAPFTDDAYNEVVKKELETSDYLLGRKTFEIWENYWPQHGDFWPGINEGTKYVLSKTRTGSDWKNSLFVNDIAAIEELKQTDGRNIQVWGSSELVHLLLKSNLVDELRLKIHPLVLGKGKRLFDDQSAAAAFQLTESTVTPAGVIIAAYKRIGEVQTGNVVV